MSWLFDLYRTNPTAQAIALISMVCMAGMALGSVKVRGIGLGTAGVLFAGILIGAFSTPIDPQTLGFVKEFGLVLFVFCIGLQLGPGFVASLRRMGLRLNALAAATVALGTLLAVGLGWLLGIDAAAIPGLLAGATTNTPSLGAAQQTLVQLPGVSDQRAALPAMAYAVCYPAAILGIIGSILMLKGLLRVDPVREALAFAAEQQSVHAPLERRTLVIDNPNLDGIAIEAVPGRAETGVVVSRIKRSGDGQVQIASSDAVLHRGDLIMAVGTQRGLDDYQRVVGRAGNEDLLRAAGALTHRRVVVTSRQAIGKTVQQLGLEQLLGVAVTRVARAGLEMTAVPSLRLQFGDVLQVVGKDEQIAAATQRLGNSLKALDETHFIPLFAGIAAGIGLGSLPIAVPGLPQPLRLGLAGGPLLVALLVGWLGKIGPLIWHMPLNANLAFREFGIALFFASVGLTAGPQFFATVFSPQGVVWLAAGASVTVLPLLIVGGWALAVWRMNFAVVAGLLAGSMTDPPALAFGTNLCDAETPTVAYAAVFPLTTLMRVLVAQVLVVVLCG